MDSMKKLVVFMFLMISPLLLQAADFKPGVHYKVLEQPVAVATDKILVQEFFWYGCPHCYTFEPFIKAWKKTKPANVEFVRVPAIFRPDWEIQAKAYYALSVMGVIEDVHGKIFEAIHKDKKRLNTLDTIADLVEKNGLDRQKFLTEYNSFAVDSMVRKAKKLQKEYEIQGVPSVAVNGKYLTAGSMAGTYDNLVKVIDYLVAKEMKK